MLEYPDRGFDTVWDLLEFMRKNNVHTTGYDGCGWDVYRNDGIECYVSREYDKNKSDGEYVFSACDNQEEGPETATKINDSVLFVLFMDLRY